MFREITSLVELNALPGLETGYLLGPDNYASVVRPINLPERDGVCQLLQKCGTACGERFKKGYLLRSKDDVLAMVGSTCGPTHFGIESDRLRRDIALADNRARHARAQDDLRIYLANVEHHTNTLRDAIGSIEEAREKVTRLLDCLAKPAALLLKDAARHGRSSIDITGVVNSNNDQGKTGRAVRIPVGSIAAHEYGNPDNLVRVADDLRAHWKQCIAG